jgi:hypothetical protein
MPKPGTLFKIQVLCSDSCSVIAVYVLNRTKFLAGHMKVNHLTFLVIMNENIQPFFLIKQIQCISIIQNGYSLHNKSLTYLT